MSHPAWVCGLKLENNGHIELYDKVTPCVGVWIETERRKDIERKERHTLRGCVD